MTEAEFANVAKQSRRTILVVQIVEGALLAAALASIVVLGLLLLDARHHITIEQAIIVSQQEKVKTEQVRIASLAAANAAEGRRIKTALCDSQFTIASAPVSNVASKLGVEFIESSRKAFVVLGCPGRLGLPPKSLIAAGTRFGVPIRY